MPKYVDDHAKLVDTDTDMFVKRVDMDDLQKDFTEVSLYKKDLASSRTNSMANS